jgi:filamentous hemagglutinin
MNTIYRLVWNRAKQCWMAAAEIASSHGPRSAAVRGGAGLSLLAVNLLSYAAPPLPPPTATPVGSNTRSYVAPNGVTVVDIATTNSAGISNNSYTQYNVNSAGLVLNNGNTTAATRQSNLAGAVYGNINLTSEARLIINQVVSTNLSTLAGFTEVLGRTADIVVVNPNGITCSGCGFINTDRVTLTTGLPVMSANGGLSGFNVTGGDIAITGTGLNGSAQQILDLLSRSVNISGQINVPNLGIYVGPNRWDYDSRAVTGSTTPSGAAPTWSIDTAALGGMYTNAIFMTSTEAGAGVRMLGNAAASSGGFTITSSGLVQIKTKVSATGNMDIKAQGAGSAVQVTDASVSAGQNLTIIGNAGVTLTGGTLTAGGNMAVTGAMLTDTANSFSQANNNQRYAGGTSTLTITGAGSLNGTQWGSAGNFQGSFADLSIGNQGATLYGSANLQLSATGGNLSLATAQIKTTGNLLLNASAALSTSAGGTQGLQSMGGNVSITTGGALTNAGSISSDVGSATLRSGGLTNSGKLHSGAAMQIADASGGSSATFSNTGSGEVISDSSLSLLATAVTNASGARIQAVGNSAVTAASLTNSGTWILSSANATPGDTVNVTGALTGDGVIQSGRNVQLTVGSASVNGKLLSTGTLGISSPGAFTLYSGGVTQSGGKMTLAAATITNGGTLQSQGDMYLSPGSGALTNNGSILATGDLTEVGQNATRVNVTNNGTFQGGTVSITADVLAIAADKAVQSQGDMTLDVNTLTFSDSKSRIVAAQSGTGTGRITVNTALSLAAGIYSLNNLEVTSQGLTVTDKGGISAVNNLAIVSVGNVSNSGSLYGGGTLEVTTRLGVGNTITNVGSASGAVGTINAGGNISLTADTIVNQSTIQGSANTTLTATTIRNNVSGGDTRTWAGPFNLTTVQTANTPKGYNGCGCVDQYEDWSWKQTWNTKQTYAGGATTLADFKPQIITGGTLTLNFNNATNMAGLLLPIR